MKITCLKEHLIKALLSLSRICTHNSTLPVLSSVCFEAKKGQLSLKATNLEIGAIITVRASIEKEGAVAVPGNLLTSVIDGLKEKKISISKQGDGIKIKTKNHNSNLKGVPVADFPLIPKIEGKSLLEVKGTVLASSIEQVISSIAISNMRPDLAGVYIARKEKVAKMVTTDGFRLSERTISLSSPSSQQEAIIVPGRTATEMMRIFGKTDGLVQLVVDDSQMAVVSPEIYLVSRLIDGNYPDYTQIIPKDFKIEVKTSKEELVNAAKSIALFSQSDTNDIVLMVSSSKKQIEVSAGSKEAGEANQRISARIKGGEAKITLNHRFLVDGLTNIKEKNITLLINDASTPLLLRGDGPAKPKHNFIYIISPIKKQ